MRLAGYVDWSRSQVAERELRRIAAFSSRTVGIDPFVALLAQDASPKDRATAEGLVFAAESNGIALIADARIDNAAAVRRALGDEESEALGPTLIHAYLKWGEQFPDILRGDFAIVLWDSARRRLVACRDPFGVRPLVYRRSGQHLWIASQPGQLAPTFTGVPELDEQAIVEHILWRSKDQDATVFREIRDVRVASTLTVTEAGVQTQQYWVPTGAVEDSPRRTVEDYYAELRGEFSQAVKRRLVTPRPAMIHVSGGLDSSSIALAANELLETDSSITRDIVGASAIYPNLDCDESVFIDAVARRLRFGVQRWDGTRSDPADLFNPSWDGPAFGTIALPRPGDHYSIADRIHAGVLLSGVGGDDLMIYSGFVRDMFRRGEWSAGLRVLFPFSEDHLGPILLRLKMFLGQLLPTRVRQARARRSAHLPAWLPRRFHSMARELAVVEAPSIPFASQVQSNTWERLRGAYLRTSINVMQARGMAHGFEFRFPFLDRELVEYVLALPARCLPRSTRAMRIHREAFRSMLPPEIANRTEKAEFGSAVRNQIKRADEAIGQLLTGKVWLSEPYVERGRFRRFWRDAVEGQAPMRSRDWSRLWSVVTLEAWLRKVFGYDSPLPEARPT